MMMFGQPTAWSMATSRAGSMLLAYPDQRVGKALQAAIGRPVELVPD